MSRYARPLHSIGSVDHVENQQWEGKKLLHHINFSHILSLSLYARIYHSSSLERICHNKISVIYCLFYMKEKKILKRRIAMQLSKYLPFGVCSVLNGSATNSNTCAKKQKSNTWLAIYIDSLGWWTWFLKIFFPFDFIYCELNKNIPIFHIML